MTIHVRPPLEPAASTVPQRDLYRVGGVVAALASASIVNLSIVLVFALSLTAAIVLGTLLGVFAILGYACAVCGADADGGA